MVRHIFDEIIEGKVDPEDDRLHAARIAWGALSRLEIMLEHELGQPVDYQYEGGIIGEPKETLYAGLKKNPYSVKCDNPQCGCTTIHKPGKYKPEDDPNE